MSVSRHENGHLARAGRRRHGSLMALFDDQQHRDPIVTGDVTNQRPFAKRSSAPPTSDEASFSQMQESPEEEELREAVDLHAPRARSLPHPHSSGHPLNSPTHRRSSFLPVSVPHHHRSGISRLRATIPRPRRRGTTRIHGSSDGESSDDEERGYDAYEGTSGERRRSAAAGLLHSVFGTEHRRDG